MKKLLSLILAVVMAFGLTVSVFASNGYGPGSSAETVAPYLPPISTADAAKTAAEAISQAAGTGGTATVSLSNVGSISPEAIKAVADAAAAANTNALIHADITAGSAVLARWYIDPKAASTLKNPIDLRVENSGPTVTGTTDLFENFFENNVSVVSFSQQGAIGINARLAVKVDLKDLNTKSLMLYSYNKATNTYTRIINSAYYIDVNGYLHFTTPFGGSIVIADKPLTLKK